MGLFSVHNVTRRITMASNVNNLKPKCPFCAIYGHNRQSDKEIYVTCYIASQRQIDYFGHNYMKLSNSI